MEFRALESRLAVIRIRFVAFDRLKLPALLVCVTELHHSRVLRRNILFFTVGERKRMSKRELKKKKITITLLTNITDALSATVFTMRRTRKIKNNFFFNRFDLLRNIIM